MEIDIVSLGKRLRSIRKNRNMTLDELGEKTGLTPEFIGQIERGLKIGKLDSLVSIVNVLGVSIEDILVDSLLVTNAGGKSKHEEDLSYLFLDCRENESRFIIKNAENVKELLKKYFQK